MAEKTLVAAWKCEECRRWRPAAEPVIEMRVLEPGPEAITDGNLIERIYIGRKLRVCTACRLEILGTPEDTGYGR